ncbi:MAG: DM13 domain-containing protein [Ilumatobacter sp.]|uniref:DM13 domain-containing protein n=1 Tax=Ilumatobacter sp. TaxID=1967498 RepID=UPI0032986C1F
MNWIRENRAVAAIVGVLGVGILAFLAFGVFGIHTEFFDDEVAEEGPVFDSGAASDIPSDVVDEAMTEEMNDFMETNDTPIEVATEEPMPPAVDEAEAAGVVVTQFEGVFGPRSHPGEGVAKVLNDGTEQRFLRFEDFATDNGPDLNVYLTTADAGADADEFGVSGQFVDLGDLKGNIGEQNYEIPVDVDLEQFDTVVIWCVRFGVAFAAADLAPAA